MNGPKRFFYYNLFESDVTGAPLAVRGRAGGSVDAYAAAVGRWLVTRDGFDFLFFYLPDYDFASHALGPGGAPEALRAERQRRGGARRGRGGLDAFLDRYDIVVCSDHGQTHVDRAVRIQDALPGDPHVLVTASNRAGMVYLLPDTAVDARSVAERLRASDGIDVALFREGGESLALREGEEIRLGQGDGDWRGRAWQALANPNAGDVIVSAAPGSSSPTSADVITRAGAHTARCSTRTPSSRCSSWAPRRRRPASWESRRSP